MNDDNIALFKLALTEGLSNRIDREISDCTEEIAPSPAHIRAMNKIVGRLPQRKLPASPKLKKIIAILIAAALLLTGCAIAYRNEIRDFFEEMYETFVKVNCTEDEGGEKLEYFYELTYLPEGYSLKSGIQEPIIARYTFVNSAGDKISFMQTVLDTWNFYMDIETGYKQIVDISRYDVYYKVTKGRSYYLWNDDTYMFSLTSDVEMTIDELNLIIEGIK